VLFQVNVERLQRLRAIELFVRMVDSSATEERRRILVVVIDDRLAEGAVELLHQRLDEFGACFRIHELKSRELVQQSAGEQGHQAHLALIRGEEIQAFALKDGGVARPVTMLNGMEEDRHIQVLGGAKEGLQLVLTPEAFAEW